MNNQDISIIIADGDCELVAKQLLANTSRVDIKIVDKVTDGESAIESIRKYQPDVVLLDICGNGWTRSNGNDSGFGGLS